MEAEVTCSGKTEEMFGGGGDRLWGEAQGWVGFSKEALQTSPVVQGLSCHLPAQGWGFDPWPGSLDPTRLTAKIPKH